MPSICPGGGDDSPYLGCFPDAFFCNLVSDCPGGIDEINCTANGNGLRGKLNTGIVLWVQLYTTISLLPCRRAESKVSSFW